MRAGNLRERVTFQTKTEVSDGMSAGGTETWTDTLTDVPATVWPIRGDEAVEFSKLEHTIDHRVRVRYQSNITASMRIKWGSRYLEIYSLIDMGSRNREIEIMASEVDA